MKRRKVIYFIISHNVLVPFLLAPRDIRKEISIGLLISFWLKSSEVSCSIGSWLKFLVGFPSVSCKVDCDAVQQSTQ